MKILILSCSTNTPSNSDTLADAFMEGVVDSGSCEVTKLHLIEYELPQFTLDCYQDNCPLPKGYIELKKLVQEADGVVIATPVWNFGVPAHLKNFLDWISCFGLDSETRSRGTLNGKPFYYIFTGGAPTPAWKGLMRFTTLFTREAIRYFGGTIAGVFYEGKCTPGRGQFGLVVDKRPERLKAAKNAGMKFGNFVKKFKETGVLPLRHRLFEKAYKRGQRIMAKL